MTSEGSIHLLGRRSSVEEAVHLARSRRVAFWRLVPLSRGFLVFELREAQ